MKQDQQLQHRFSAGRFPDDDVRVDGGEFYRLGVIEGGRVGTDNFNEADCYILKLWRSMQTIGRRVTTLKF